MYSEDIADLISELREIKVAIQELKQEDPEHILPDDYIMLLKHAMEKWGYGSQALLWIEEMSELIQSIAKRDRNINPSNDAQIAEEIADVDICLDQAKLEFPEYLDFKKQKIERLRRLVYHG